MKNFSTEEILSLVNLTLMDQEGIHYHFDPETQFYNQCHDEDGKFCSGGPVSGKTDLRDSDGKRGKLGGSLVDPHEGTKTFDGLKGYSPIDGKPVPGTDAWLEAHGMTKELFESRPYVKFEASKTDPALLQAFDRGSKGAKQWDRLAEQEGQEGGYIMYKHKIPDSPYPEISPQVRPNQGAVTNHAKRAQKKASLEYAKERYQNLKTGKIKPEDLVKEQAARVKQKEVHLERTKKATPEMIREEAHKGLEDAQKAYSKAKLTKDPEMIQAARKDVAAAKREVTHSEYRAAKFKPESAIYHAEKDLVSSKQRLAEIKEDPKAFHAAEIIRQGGTDGKGGRIARAEKAFKDEKAKYLFTKGEDVARIDINPDKQNVKNLMNGKGRIYFAMEGSIKNDAILAAVKREDPTAAVVNVPSVTLWHNKHAGEGEITWFAKTHGKDREIVLIPDADGVKNINVMRQANALATALKNHGAKEVLVAAPPTKHGTKKEMDPIKLPSTDGSGKPVFDERKGIDDHLGAGRGTLGQLAYQMDAKIPRYSLSHLTTAEGATKETGKVNKNGLDNLEKMLGAISGIAGKKGAVQVSVPLLMQMSGITSKGSATSARDKLQELGIIDIHYVFNKETLYKTRKRVPDMSQKDVDYWVKQKVIKPPPEDLFAKDDYEASPILVIKNPKYIVKEENTSTGVLSDRPSWKPPKSYDGWRSPLTGKKDTTGQARRMEAEEAKTKAAPKPTAKVSVVKTAEQRAAAKKAPPGKRLVRTAEGAKRYGVPVGSPIPEMATAITSTVLLSAVMSEEDLIAFYNQCHDEGGRFCEGEGGKGSGPVTGNFLLNRNIRKVADAGLTGTVEVDGIKAKEVYEATARNGDVIRLYDKSGKVGRYKDELLNNHVRMHEMYPLQPPRNIVVTEPEGLIRDSEIGPSSFAVVRGNSRNTYVNAEMLGVDTGDFQDGFQMPSAKKGDTNNMDYMLTHEYGHHLDFARHSDNGFDYDKHPLWENEAFQDNMSRYGKSDARGIEAYSEAFAEWHHTGGKTENPAAIAMARYEGWVGADNLRSSGEEVSLVNNALVHFAKDDVKELPDDEDVNSDIPENKGIVVIDDLDGPKVIGDFKVNEPSAAEIDRANKIMAEVLEELGLERNE